MKIEERRRIRKSSKEDKSNNVLIERDVLELINLQIIKPYYLH
jgi:hypothetical protein